MRGERLNPIRAVARASASPSGGAILVGVGLAAAAAAALARSKAVQYSAVAAKAADDATSAASTSATQERTVARRLREARFPDLKTLEQIDWQALQGVSRPLIEELSSCQYLASGDDVVIAGPIGTGKTHLAIALGVEAAKRRHRVAFTRAADLVRELLEAREERALTRLHKRYRKVSLLIIDELGFVPLSKTGAELLFEVFSQRYERGSTLVTSNLGCALQLAAGLRERGEAITVTHPVVLLARQLKLQRY